jgi:hypothetical protein
MGGRSAKDPKLGPYVAQIVGEGVAPPKRRITGRLANQRFAPSADEVIHFDGAEVEEVDFSGGRFYLFAVGGSTFRRCDFAKARFKVKATFSYDRPNLFIDCSFDGADLRNFIDHGANRYERCSFRDARIKGWYSWCSEFVDCTFVGTIERCAFDGRPNARFCPEVARSVNDFRGNDFREAVLVDTQFGKGIDISAQLWPSGPEYRRFDRWMERIAEARRAVLAWPASGDRDRALYILKIYSSGGYEDQPEVFLPRDAFTRPDEQRVLALIEGVSLT